MGPREAWPAPRPRYALSDAPALLWRERWLMLAVFLAVAAVGVIFAITLKTLYPAQASVLVKLGQEYVYQPRVGDAGRGAAPDVDQLVQSETEIMRSPDVRMAVVRRIGVAKLDPGVALAYAGGSSARRALLQARAADQLGRAVKIDTAPATPIVRLTYENADPALAARVLNTLLDEYLLYRRAVVSTPSSGAALAAQRRMFEARLATADAAYDAFLKRNEIADFDADRTTLSQLAGQIEQQQFQADAQLKEKSGRLAAIDAELAGLPAEAALYHDTDPTASTKLAELRVQRETLLSKYKPEAQPVKDLDAQIAQLEAGVAAGRTLTRGPERTGPNPVYQTFQTERLELSAEVEGLRQTEAALTAEMARLTDRRLRLAELEPQYQALNVDRDALQSNVKDLTAKADENEASRAIGAADQDDIRVVARAAPPTEGRSLRKPALLIALAFAAFSALCAGLGRMYLRPGMPTPGSASRTLELPVLGAAPLKQPA